MATPISAFNNQLIAFVEDLTESFPEETSLKTALEALRGLKRMNPKLLHTGFMEYIYPGFHEAVKSEDETTLISKARAMLDGEHRDYAFAYVIFDKHWSTMAEPNKKAIWNWCKVLVVLAERARDSS
jgi:hypothetical protein